jgi:hypothetical protein
MTTGRPLSWAALIAAWPTPRRAASSSASATAKYAAASTGAGSCGLVVIVAAVVVAMPHAITSLPLALQMANLLRLCLVVRLTASH